MSEQSYQSKVIKQLEKDGWYVLKLITTNKNGIPDLLALKDGEKPWFKEMKAVNGVASKLQKYRIKELNTLGFRAEFDYEK